MEKYNQLVNEIKQYERAVVAFSGGVDSSFLIKACKDALGDNVVAVTIDTFYIPRWELKEAKELAKQLGVKHEIISCEMLPEIENNPEDRCYHCKKHLFSTILEYAKSKGIQYVFDGSNNDDRYDYRPGMKALKELEVVSPLAQLSKQEIRTYSKELGLPTHDKPPYACLLTRLPYNQPITKEEVLRVERAETYIMSLGIKAVRVRAHKEIARIELTDITKAFDCDLLAKIDKELKSYGFSHVTLDIGGYKMGNHVRAKGEKNGI